jgi:hypothetical protein
MITTIVEALELSNLYLNKDSGKSLGQTEREPVFVIFSPHILVHRSLKTGSQQFALFHMNLGLID